MKRSCYVSVFIVCSRDVPQITQTRVCDVFVQRDVLIRHLPHRWRQAAGHHYAFPDLEDSLGCQNRSFGKLERGQIDFSLTLSTYHHLPRILGFKNTFPRTFPSSF